MSGQEQGVIRHGVPPPPYSERETVPVQFQIRRKPISVDKLGSKKDTTVLGHDGIHTLASSKDEAEHLADPIRTPYIPPHTTSPPPIRTVITDGELTASPSSTSGSAIPSQQDTTSTSLSFVSDTSPATESASGSWKKAAAGHAQKAFQEARHFVGGLIEHPSVSNKHYTILRHSHGVVFYQGSNTFLAISIFVDEPLPKDRTIWMQCKGWSGKTGMKAKALFGLNDSWLNVTPTLAIQPDQVNPNDERAWQRDIKRFRKKASGTPLEHHVLRETAIIRVPVETADGYYQLVLCRGDQKRKVLCTSPVFRVISTSSDPSTLRGASLSTLPIELGLWIGGLAYQPLMPSGKTQFALQTAYMASGLEDRIDTSIEDAGGRYEQMETEAFSRLGPTDVSIENGPTAPYPVDFVAKIDVQVSTSSYDLNGLPKKINLRSVPERILPRLDGHYFAWCKLLHTTKPNTNIGDEKKIEPGQPWLKCIISASSVVFEEWVSNVRSRKALKIITSIKIIEDIDIPPTTQVQIRIMGFIRPPKPTTAPVNHPSGEGEGEQQMVLDICDIELSCSTLDNPTWQPDYIPGSLSSHRSVDGSEPEKQAGLWDKAKDGYANVRLKGQTMVGQIPFHRVGIRTPTDELKDKNLAVTGFYIQR
ncbi:LipA and NB-ARC domain protein [Talaromyces stipitatus ATCC 10500]|uniref:LipA and NB-ARC domain protein n=1 Tax=Talaromyces stipitatus (strain ATCC 10500 / CBS 375.48 / QM 6759 / NRRL 1006) TaxID=441959 RepID=B8M418_TALSN|nr:LipA and NB-ARC domain protein [Talaromyces stipitatus ATCC 10500]EED20761.1 LipA and NB-ARC domain protein [Talaromyces stipitatus ATCC 10500]